MGGRAHQIRFVFLELLGGGGVRGYQLDQNSVLPVEEVPIGLGDASLAGEVREFFGVAPSLGNSQLIRFRRELRALLIQLRPQFAVIQSDEQQLSLGRTRPLPDRRTTDVTKRVELRPQRVGIDRLHLAVAA